MLIKCNDFEETLTSTLHLGGEADKLGAIVGALAGAYYGTEAIPEAWRSELVNIKEIKMRPGINTHEYNVKIKALSKFIGGGNKVKVSMRYRGREIEHQHIGIDLLHK